MILDVRTYIWSSLDQLGREIADCIRSRSHERLIPLEAFVSQHERAMSCVDGSFVFGFRSHRLGAEIPNELVAEFVSRDPRRRIGIAGIDPMTRDALDQVQHAHSLGLVGVSVSPACQGFHPSHSEAMRVYEMCSELALPVFVTSFEPLTPSAVMEFGQPFLWDEVAQCFPKLPIVISQLGFPWIDETLVMLGKHPSMYADISGVASRPWQLYNALLTATSLGVMNKLLFGSGFPFDTPAKAIEAMYSVNSYSHGTQLPSVPRSQIRGIVERDSLACLGIDSEVISRRPASVNGVEDPATIEIGELLEQRRSLGQYPGGRA